jgi:hypothetical protein
MVPNILKETLLAGNFSFVRLYNILQEMLYGADTNTSSTHLDDNDEC